MNGLRQPIDSPGGLPSARRQRPWLTWTPQPPARRPGRSRRPPCRRPTESTPGPHRLGPGNPLVIPLDLADGKRVHLALYNAPGQRVRQLWDGPLPAGSHRFVWDGRRKGKALAAGVYLYKLEVGGQTISRKTIRIP